MKYKKIKNYENYYVYEDGSVYSCNINDFMLISPNKEGYCIAGLYSNGKKKKIGVHRLVANAFIPNPDNLPIPNHKDHDRSNNHVDNLEWVTVGENNKYAIENNRRNHGDKIYQFDLNGNFINEYKNCSVAKKETGISGINEVILGKAITSGGYFWSKKREFELRDNKPRNRNSRVYQLDPQTLNIIASYNNAKDAGDSLGISSNCITRVCSGLRKTYKGFIWKREDDINEKPEWVDWVELDEFPGYRICNDGRIYSEKSKRILDPKPNDKGYKIYQLYTNTGITKNIGGHRLVAMAYINNDLQEPVVNHLDNIGTNNKLENLEWTDYPGNAHHAYDNGYAKPNPRKKGYKFINSKRDRKRVCQYDKEGNFIQEYESINLAAQKTNTNKNSLRNCLAERRGQTTAGGFKWTYAE